MNDYSKRLGKKRLRFRDWLIDKLDTNHIDGVQWIDRERGLFKIPWVHGSCHGWNINDVEIFRQWAVYSGKYELSRDVADPKKWKTNFRCTMNALRDFKEVRNEGSSRGARRFKIYSLESIGRGKRKQSECEKEEKQTGATDLTDKEIVQLVDEMMTPEPIPRPALQKPLLVTRARPNAAYPAFETLVLGKSTGMSPFPRTPWMLAAWNAMAVDQHVEKPDLEKFEVEGAEESGADGKAEGIQTKKRTFTKEELADDQEIINLVDQMSADSDTPSPEDLGGMKGSNEEEDEMPSDQEIIDLVDQMSDQNNSSLDELDGKEGSLEEEDEMPSDQEIIDLVDQMSDQNGSSYNELDDREGSLEEGEEVPSDQEIIDLVDQMAD